MMADKKKKPLRCGHTDSGNKEITSNIVYNKERGVVKCV